MAVFGAKNTNQMPNVAPEIVECDNRLAAVEKRKYEVIYAIGLQYVNNNDVQSATGTIYEECMKELKSLEEETIFLEKRKLAVQGLRKCEKCGNILVLDSAFCNKCGEKLGELFPAAQPVSNVCAQCGAPYEADAAFCTNCGNKLQ